MVAQDAELKMGLEQAKLACFPRLIVVVVPMACTASVLPNLGAHVAIQDVHRLGVLPFLVIR